MMGGGAGTGAAVSSVLGTSDAALARRIRADFGLEPARLTRVGGGADSAAVVWRAAFADGTEYAAKLSARPRMRIGLALTARLAANGVAGIPPPLPALTGRPWTMRDGTVLSLTRWIDGRVGTEGGLDAGQWTAFGTLLGAVHAVPAAELPEALRAELPRETYATPMVTDTRNVDARLRAGPSLADDLAAEIAVTWLDASARLLRLADRAEDLARRLRDRPARFALCHGDAHILNLLVGSNGRITLIDWDDVILAPPERDLMFVLGGGVLADPLITAEQQAWFTEGYGDARADPDRLAFYLGTRAIDDAAQFAELGLDATRRSPAERRTALHWLRSLLAPSGLVTLAGG